MMIGHYAVGFAGKKINKVPSLGTMFIAVQWLDLLWPVLVLLGVEKVSIEQGNTEMTPLNFVSYPWSHSMLMAIAWGILFAVVYYLITKNRNASILMLFLVFSHWVLDWIVHRPDLQITPFSELRVGLDLWDHKYIAIVVEVLIFIVGAFLYMKATKPKNKTGSWSLWVLIIFLIVIYFMNVFGPPPDNVNIIAWVGVSQWLLAAWGYWIDRNRI